MTAGWCSSHAEKLFETPRSKPSWAISSARRDEPEGGQRFSGNMARLAGHKVPLGGSPTGARRAVQIGDAARVRDAVRGRRGPAGHDPPDRGCRPPPDPARRIAGGRSSILPEGHCRCPPRPIVLKIPTRAGHVYVFDWRVPPLDPSPLRKEKPSDGQGAKQPGVVPGAAVWCWWAFSAVIPLRRGQNYSVQDTFGNKSSSGRRLGLVLRMCYLLPRVHGALRTATRFSSAIILAIQIR